MAPDLMRASTRPLVCGWSNERATMPDANAVKSAVKAFILEQFLPGEDPSELTDSVELMTLGILDSMAIMQLVSFMEERFGVSFEANELGKDHMNTLDSIAALVVSKL
jgi:acyl carrier protein